MASDKIPDEEMKSLILVESLDELWIQFVGTAVRRDRKSHEAEDNVQESRLDPGHSYKQKAGKLAFIARTDLHFVI